MHGILMATSRVENSDQVLSYQLKLVHALKNHLHVQLLRCHHWTKTRATTAQLSRKLIGETQKVVWAKFSTLSWAVFVMSVISMAETSMSTTRLENSAKVLSCQFKFVHALKDHLHVQIQQFHHWNKMLARTAQLSQKLIGETQKVVWAKFSTLSWAVFVMSVISMAETSTSTTGLENSAKVLSCQFKFVHALKDHLLVQLMQVHQQAKFSSLDVAVLVCVIPLHS